MQHGDVKLKITHSKILQTAKTNSITQESFGDPTKYNLISQLSPSDYRPKKPQTATGQVESAENYFLETCISRAMLENVSC